MTIADRAHCSVRSGLVRTRFNAGTRGIWRPRPARWTTASGPAGYGGTPGGSRSVLTSSAESDLLDDLARIDEQALQARPVTPPVRVTLLLLKIAAGNRRLASDLRRWADELRAVLDRPGGVEEFVAMLRYIEVVGEAPAEELHDLVATLGPEAEEAYVTTAEMLRTEGRTEGRADALVQLLTIKFGQLPQAVVDTVHAAAIEELESWTARVLTANTLDEALR